MSKGNHNWIYKGGLARKGAVHEAILAMNHLDISLAEKHLDHFLHDGQ
jgi:hypothetical protein